MLRKQSEELSKKTFDEHYSELRKRLLWSVLVFVFFVSLCFTFSGQIYDFLVLPLGEILHFRGGRKLIFTGLTEGFMTQLRLAMYFGAALSSPFFIGQSYLFLAPGLYRKEKVLLLSYMFSSVLLFLIGVLMVYYLVMPAAWKFFLSFENFGDGNTLPIVLEARVSEYLDLILELSIGFGVAFQLPLILVMLIGLEFLSVQTLVQLRRYAIVAIFVLAAILTPPDVFSQISLALPLLLLYETAVFIGKFIEKRRKLYARHQAH